MKKKFGIVGKPIKHSLSPVLHKYWFKKYSIKADYEIIEADDKALPGIIKKIKQGEYTGINVTLPFKQKIINYLDKITLNYNQNSLSFDFEAPTFHGSKKHSFYWQLKGYDKTVNESKNSTGIVYSKLPPGKYSLDIKATNVDGISSIQSFHIDIIIKNPFWLSHLAFMCYVLFGSGLVYLFFLISKLLLG